MRVIGILDLILQFTPLFLCFLLLSSRNLTNFNIFRKCICHYIKDNMDQMENMYQEFKHAFIILFLNLSFLHFKRDLTIH